MPNLVICVSGKIGSGKTSISKEVSSLINVPYFSTGDFIKEIAAQRGIELVDRKTLQAIGLEYVNRGWNKFSSDFLTYCNWSGTMSLLIDGVRDHNFFLAIREAVNPIRSILVYIESDELVRVKRIEYRDSSYIAEMDSHETESGYDLIRSNSDIVVENNQSPKCVAKEVVNAISCIFKL